MKSPLYVSLCTVICIVLPFSVSFAQTYTHRGFLETGVTFYPQRTANDRARGVGESLYRYEAFYRPFTKFQVGGAIDFRIDTHHQVRRDFNLSWQDREIQRPLAAVRRLSAIYNHDRVTLEVGKQFIRWGKTDIVTPIDRFAPRDFLTVVDNEFLAVTATRLNYEKGANTLELVWSPRFTPSRIPLPNQRWSPAPPQSDFPVKVRTTAVDFPGGSQAGIRWNHAGTIEYEFALYQGFDHLPSFEVAAAEFNPNGLELDLRRFNSKLLMIGGDVAIPAPLFIIKAEAAYFGSRDDRSDEYALYVLQLERQAGEWFFVGGYAGEAITQHGSRSSNFAPDRGLTKTILGRAGLTIDTNRSIAVETAVRQNADGFWLKGEYSQALGQHWRATVNLTLIRGQINDFLGQYRQNSHALVLIRYSF